MSWYHATDRQLLFSKNDKEDPRLGECIQISDDLDQIIKTSFDFAILGYPDDEGIKLNGGRPGAFTAPLEVRRFLYKMTPHLQAQKQPRLVDLGNLITDIPLEERHRRGRETIKTLASHNKSWISLGGGHDYGYCDSTGFVEAFQNEAVVINFDAHMDVRPTRHGLNSGTPFFRLLSEFSGRVDFAEVGIQNQCNSQKHVQWACAKGAHVITLDELNEKGLRPCLQDFLQGKEKKKMFLSVDIDAFTSSEAPGCSQSWTTGLFTREFLNTLRWLVTHFDVRGLGIYEVSPALDQDHRTSKLAALIVHHFIFDSLKKA